MPVVEVSSAAERDIRELLLYVGHKERSPSGALRLVEALEKAFALHAANPFMGTANPISGKNDRVFSCGTKSNPRGWVVFYQPIQNGIQILRVFRAGQNYSELF